MIKGLKVKEKEANFGGGGTSRAYTNIRRGKKSHIKKKKGFLACKRKRMLLIVLKRTTLSVSSKGVWSDGVPWGNNILQIGLSNGTGNSGCNGSKKKNVSSKQRENEYLIKRNGKVAKGY